MTFDDIRSDDRLVFRKEKKPDLIARADHYMRGQDAWAFQAMEHVPGGKTHGAFALTRARFDSESVCRQSGA